MDGQTREGHADFRLCTCAASFHTSPLLVIRKAGAVSRVVWGESKLWSQMA